MSKQAGGSSGLLPMVVSKTYTLHIAAYTPETIPMARLAEYMQKFAKMLGHENAVHFQELRAGSTQLAARVEHEQIPKVHAQLERIAQGEAPPDIAKAQDELDRLLAADNAAGFIYKDDDQDAKVIDFPGVNRTKPISYGPFTEEGTLDGVLISIGGADQTVHLRLQNGDVTYTGLETSRDIARRLGMHLYEPIRARGSGRWFREESGSWTLRRFKVVDFEVLEKTDLRTAVGKLRAIAGGDWKSMDDPIAALKAIRDSSNEMH